MVAERRFVFLFTSSGWRNLGHDVLDKKLSDHFHVLVQRFGNEFRTKCFFVLYSVPLRNVPPLYRTSRYLTNWFLEIRLEPPMQLPSYRTFSIRSKVPVAVNYNKHKAKFIPLYPISFQPP